MKEFIPNFIKKLFKILGVAFITSLLFYILISENYITIKKSSLNVMCEFSVESCAYAICVEAKRSELECINFNRAIIKKSYLYNDCLKNKIDKNIKNDCYKKIYGVNR